MPAAPKSRIPWHPQTDQDRDLVRRELSEVLQAEPFCHSKRYPALLRYVVETKLSGQEDQLKERTLGVEVFQRRPDYDTNSDTVVRFAASEVRRRLASYYHEDGADRPIHILLPSGAYVPEFLVRDSLDPPTVETQPPMASIAEVALHPDGFTTPAPPRRRRYIHAAILLATCLALSMAAVFFVQHRQQNASNTRFWQPFLSGSQSVLICPGTVVFSPTSKSGVAPAGNSNIYPFVTMDTAMAISLLTDQVGAHHTNYQVESTPAVTLMDLRAGPAIMVGAYTNSWTLRLLSDLPFRFSPQPKQEIYDAARPGTLWVRTDTSSSPNGADYAVIARFRSSLTNNMVMVIAGLGSNGTEAAAQFVASPVYLTELDHTLPSGWSSKNIEVVLKISVVEGQTGAPSIEAYRVW
jgi:hypothetical protein